MKAAFSLLLALGLAAPPTGCQDSEQSGAAGSARASQATIAAAGDLGLGAPGMATLDAMKRQDPRFYLAIGDLSYAGPRSAPEFCRRVHAELGPRAPFEILAGNHEEDSGEDGPIAEYARCLPDRAGSHGEYARQYFFDVGRLARVIMISPDLTIDGKHYFYGKARNGRPNANLAWLERAIDEARARGTRWVIVGMHKNCISVGQYYCDVYQGLFSTLLKKRVDLVLSGHDHTYQRSKQLAEGPGCPEVTVDRFNPKCVVAAGDSYRKGAGTAFVISGAGGQPLYKLNPRDPEARYFVATMGENTPGRRNGFASLALSQDELSVRFVGSTRGSFADRFAITSP